MSKPCYLKPPITCLQLENHTHIVKQLWRVSLRIWVNRKSAGTLTLPWKYTRELLKICTDTEANNGNLYSRWGKKGNIITIYNAPLPENAIIYFERGERLTVSRVKGRCGIAQEDELPAKYIGCPEE